MLLTIPSCAGSPRKRIKYAALSCNWKSLPSTSTGVIKEGYIDRLDNGINKSQFNVPWMVSVFPGTPVINLLFHDELSKHVNDFRSCTGISSSYT